MNWPHYPVEITANNTWPLTIINPGWSSILRSYGSAEINWAHSSFHGLRSRGSHSAPTSLIANDNVAGFLASPYIAGGYRENGAIMFFVGSSPGTGSYPTYITFETTASGSTARLERMRLAPNGFLGVGYSNPSYQLDVNGQVRASSFITSSDARFKSNVSKISNALETISKVEGYTYKFKSEEFHDRNFPNGTKMGFLGQQIGQFLPEIVSEDEDGYLSVEYTALIPLIVEAIKEIKTELNQAKELISLLTPPSFEDAQKYKIDKVFLSQNYPNPSSSITKISYAIPEGFNDVAIDIFDLNGEKMKSFANLKNNGEIEINSAELGSGVFFYSLSIDGTYLITKKLIIN
jgi:hypothetical protein